MEEKEGGRHWGGGGEINEEGHEGPFWGDENILYFEKGVDYSGI